MKWKILPKRSDDITKQLLINRGIKTEKEKELFFNPKLSDFEKDFVIAGIEKAQKRILQAIKNGELIIVYGDYDVDGICGAAVLYLGLTSLGAKVLPYIPHREKEGYGLSKLGLEFARDSGASVVITTDCGIVAFEESKFAKEAGLDLIITDHHQPLGSRRPDCLVTIFSTALCGTAVTWSVIRSLISKEKSEDLLDLVGIATVSDMMPLLGVNRALVKKGLEKLNSSKRVGLLALFAEADLSLGEIKSYEIGHIIAPRLNAMGRLEHAIDSLRLLCTKDEKKARNLADIISQTNIQRKELTQQAIDQAKGMIDNLSKIHIVSSPDWSPGIIGLVAGRICDESGCSAIAISVGQDFSKGSARASEGVNIVELLRRCSDLFIAVGGHEAAAGFTIENSKIEKLKQRMKNLIKDQQEVRERILEIEALINTDHISMDLAKKIEDFEPFGVGNLKPILATSGIQIYDIRTVGDGKHLKFRADGLDAIAFGMGELKDMLSDKMSIDLAYNLEIDNWNNLGKLQLKVKDLKI